MRRNLIGAAMGVVAAGAVLTACGGGSGGGSAAAGTSSAGTSSTAAAAASTSDDSSGTSAASNAQTIEVTATEFAFSLPTTHLAPGTYTFVMKNAGHATHALSIDGPGADDKDSGSAGPGGTASLTVTLQSGKYVLYCPVGNHRSLGMQTDLTVG